MHGKTSTWTIFRAAAVGAGVFLVAFFVFHFFGITELLMEQFGGFGGLSGGAAGSIWPLAGLLIFLVVLVCQRKELKHQQIALNKQGEELALAKRRYEHGLKQLEAELVDLLRNRDEERFFQLFHEFRSMSDTASALGVTGRNAFSVVASNLKEQLESSEENSEADDLPSRLPELLKAHDQEFGHYFRMLEHLLSYIHEHATPDPDNPSQGLDAKKCAGLVGSGLSIGEMQLILCRGVYFPELHALLEQYGILESLPEESIPGGNRLRARYPRTRFAPLDESYRTPPGEGGAFNNADE